MNATCLAKCQPLHVVDGAYVRAPVAGGPPTILCRVSRRIWRRAEARFFQARKEVAAAAGICGSPNLVESPARQPTIVRRAASSLDATRAWILPPTVATLGRYRLRAAAARSHRARWHVSLHKKALRRALVRDA